MQLGSLPKNPEEEEEEERNEKKNAGAACRQPTAGRNEDALQQFFVRCNICYLTLPLCLSLLPSLRRQDTAGHVRF